MNERIKQLAIEAKLYAHTEYEKWAAPADGFGGVPSIREIYDKKFARLIVRECALQCNHNDDMDRILEYFGVEE